MDLCRDNKQQKKQILTAELERMDAVTIIQDLDPPISTYLETAGSIISEM